MALKYVPPDVTSRKFCKKPGTSAKGALEILVREARNLMATRSNGTSDPFCKRYQSDLVLKTLKSIICSVYVI